jgi:hypothetical protein
LDKAGNSNTSEREAILERLLKLVPAKRIHGFTADREFIGAKWFKTLLESGLNPVIRIKSDTFIKHREKSAPAWVFFNATKQGAVDELIHTKTRLHGFEESLDQPACRPHLMIVRLEVGVIEGTQRHSK